MPETLQRDDWSFLTEYKLHYVASSRDRTIPLSHMTIKQSVEKATRHTPLPQPRSFLPPLPPSQIEKFRGSRQRPARPFLYSNYTFLSGTKELLAWSKSEQLSLPFPRLSMYLRT